MPKLQKNLKDKKLQHSLHNMLIGFGSIFNLFGQSYFQKPFIDNDNEAFAYDKRQLEKDFEKAFQLLSSEEK